MEFTQTENELLPDEPAEDPSGLKEFLSDLLETVVLAVVLFFAINSVSARVRVDGFSMQPTLQDGEYVLVSRLAYKFDQPQFGDIIVFRSPISDQDLIKRVIGLPGDHIKIFDDKVVVNDQTLNEPYIAASPRYDGEWEVPDAHLFVLGDNRNDSQDSHAWGVLPMENVIGKAILIYWPASEWAMIEHIDTALLEVP